MLDDAALDAAHGSSFLPPVIDGKPATATYRITYDFAP
jgi:outer membrane biosynthesis protein TonB